VHQAIDGLDLAANIVLLRCVVEVLDRGMLFVTAKDEFGFFLPIVKPLALLAPIQLLGKLYALIRLVHILDLQYAEVTVIPEIAKRNPRALLKTKLVNAFFGDVEGDGHGKESAVCQADVLHDSAV
jgi:hypothetical protein